MSFDDSCPTLYGCSNAQAEMLPQMKRSQADVVEDCVKSRGLWRETCLFDGRSWLIRIVLIRVMKLVPLWQPRTCCPVTVAAGSKDFTLYRVGLPTNLKTPNEG